MKTTHGDSDKKILVAAIFAAFGVVDATTNTASAALVADGAYNLVINTTPTFTTSYGATAYKVGKDGAWNSSFTLGGYAPDATSQGMSDNNVSVASNGGPRGSSIGGDGWAGILGITVTGNSFTVNGVSGMGGTIDNAGNMILNVTGRLGAVSLFPALYDERWNVDDCTLTSTGCINNGNTLWSAFSTTSATAAHPVTGPVTIHGAPVTAQGDVNADGVTDYKAILVAGGQIGSDWGGFVGAGAFETWNIQLQSTTAPHSGFNVDTIRYTAGGDFAQYAAVPIPGAVWLFGSGLLALVGPTWRRKNSPSS